MWESDIKGYNKENLIIRGGFKEGINVGILRVKGICF